jgi:hypothetical protein
VDHRATNIDRVHRPYGCGLGRRAAVQKTNQIGFAEPALATATDAAAGQVPGIAPTPDRSLTDAKEPGGFLSIQEPIRHCTLLPT